jgi:hypothetical protein
MNHVPNPFTNRGVITNADDFFGREYQINEILMRLRTMQSSSVIGERRIGKSSLLYHLKLTGAQRLNNSSYRFLYLNLQEAQFHTVTGFLKAVLKDLAADAEAIKPDDSLSNRLIAFTEQIKVLEQAGQRVVLCLNEFENTIKRREEYTEAFFDHMRALLEMRRLAFATSTQKNLQALSMEGQLSSPFYNVFSLTELRGFTEDEARQFVDKYRPLVNFTEDEYRFITSSFDSISHHPLKLQILCDWTIRNRDLGLSDWALAEEIAKEYSNLFVGRFDPRQLRRAKRMFSLDNIKRVLDVLKAGKDVISGSKKE